MSDPNPQWQPPPPPPVETEPERKRPAYMMVAGIVLFVLGLAFCGVGIAGLIVGGIGLGLSVAALGILLFGLSFARLPYVPDPPPPMSVFERLAGIFFEPTRVFKNLRAHPRWLAAILIIGILNGAYTAAFIRRLTPERIVNFTMDAMEESPIKPPPDRMAAMRDQEIEKARATSYQASAAVQKITGAFFLMAFIAALYLLGALAFGGRMHFWQAFSVAIYSALPVVIIQKLISFIILFVKSPDDIHPLIGQETLVYDNLGLLFSSKEHPVFFVLASAIGVLSLYKLWLTAKGLHHGGTKVSSSAGWGVSIILWIIALLFGVSMAAIFPSFLG